MARGERVLLGFDFPFGYPAGFAARLGLVRAALARRLGRDRRACCDDSEDNRNNRFTIAAEFNRRVSDGCFPFWGCPAGFDDAFSRPQASPTAMTATGLAERRLIDRA